MINDSVLEKISYLTGNKEIIETIAGIPAREAFDPEITEYLSDVSKLLLSDKRSREFSDVVTFAFWIRAASLNKLKEMYEFKDDDIHSGRGLAFHIAPSNVPVNFAYSLVAGLLSGNANIVRVPGKDFPQVELIVDAFNRAFDDHEAIRPYILLVRYGHDKEINDMFSSMSDVRIIWGGDETIAELRQSPLPPRSSEITFADRYSLAVIDSDKYLALADKKRVAEDFYNDTYFTDQNACTSPRVVVWLGKEKEKARKEFWSLLHQLVKQKYGYQDIQGVNKLTSAYLTAVAVTGVKVIPHEDNLVVRVEVPEVSAKLMDYKDNSGFFFEYLCDDIMEIRDICNDKRCQTIGIIGSSECIIPLLKSGVKGVDRVVPVGKTMDFDLIWDGYDLMAQMTRCVKISKQL